MQERKKMLSEENEKKMEKILQMKNGIRKWKAEENPLVKHLREHFKALKDELGVMMD